MKLSGIALRIWQEVVCGGQHLEVIRDGRRLAVILPVEDYETMQKAVSDGSS